MTRRAPAPPPTSCLECQHAELSGLANFACLVSVLWSGTCPHQRGYLSGLAGVLAAAVGGPVTWYEKHRAAWISDGEPAELARMLRHVEAPRACS